MHKHFLHILLIAFCGILLFPKQMFALSEHYYDEDFITASIVIADPSDKTIYSVFGHACIRMQCPSEGLDFCFSYESEGGNNKVLRFLAGKLNMGLFAVPIDEYIDEYRKDGRGVYEYQLNLPLEVRRELWRLLDEQLMQGVYLHYDYYKRGCAITSFHFIEKALGDIQIEYGPWENKLAYGTTREMVNIGSYGYPAFRYFVSTIAGYDSDLDGQIANQEKLIAPIDLVHVLQNATVDGEPLLSNKCNVLLEPTYSYKEPWLTSQLIAVILLLLAIVNCFIRKPYLDWLFLGIQTIFGIVMTYLVLFSSLPLTDWNWLIIPYNILPIVAWHWRRYWALPYAGLMLIWLLAILAMPHFLVLSANLIFVAAWILVLLKNSNLHKFLPKSQN